MSRTKQGYRIEMNPTPEQRATLVAHAGLSRFVENFALDKIRAAFDQRRAEESYGIPPEQQTRAPWGAIDLERLWRAEHKVVAPWFAEMGLSSRVPKEACRLRAVGLKTWWNSKSGHRRGRRVGFPRLRKRKHGLRFKYDADTAYPLDTETVHLPRIGKLSVRESMSWLLDRMRAQDARILGTTIRERAGRWWVTFQLEVNRADINARRAVPASAPMCGVDLGLKTFAVVVNDTGETERVQAPQALKAAQRRLRRANKAVSRRQKDSKNRAKACMAVAAIHLRVANRRSDFLHKLTTRLVRTKRAIAVESLNVAGMIRNRRVAQAIADAGFAEFARQLTYKANWYGSKVWAADRWYPSSKRCSACGAINNGLTLADRAWLCLCGAEHDRDHNAAGNLLFAMQEAV